MKGILEFIPLLVFFIAFKKFGIITATVILTITTIASVAILYLKTKKISMPLLISTITVCVFGFLTWFFANPTFIKMKPTIVNLIFATILLSGYFFKKAFIKHLFAGAINLSNDAWLVLTVRFALFFIFMALMNEIVWRNYSEELWVNMKVFASMPISIAFTISQMPFILRQQKKFKEINEPN